MIHRRSSQNGFTLTETLVYCLLLGLFAAIFFFALPTRRNRISEELNRSLEQANIAVVTLKMAIANSASQGIYLRNNGQTLVVLSALNDEVSNITYTNSGKIEWRSWHYFSLKEKQLLHHVKSIGEPRPLSRISEPETLVIAEQDLVRTLVHGVETFRVEQTSSEFQISLSVGIDDSRFPMLFAVRPRNQ